MRAGAMEWVMSARGLWSALLWLADVKGNGAVWGVVSVQEFMSSPRACSRLTPRPDDLMLPCQLMHWLAKGAAPAFSGTLPSNQSARWELAHAPHALFSRAAACLLQWRQ